MNMRHAAAGQALPVLAQPPAVYDIGTINGGSPVATLGIIPARASAMEMRFNAVSPRQLTFTMSNASHDPSASLLAPDGRIIGHLSPGAPLTASVDKGTYTLRFTRPETMNAGTPKAEDEFDAETIVIFRTNITW